MFRTMISRDGLRSAEIILGLVTAIGKVGSDAGHTEQIASRSMQLSGPEKVEPTPGVQYHSSKASCVNDLVIRIPKRNARQVCRQYLLHLYILTLPHSLIRFCGGGLK